MSFRRLSSIFAKQQEVSKLLKEIQLDLKAPLIVQDPDDDLLIRGHNLADKCDQRQKTVANRILGFLGKNSGQAGGVSNTPAPPPSRPKACPRFQRKVKPVVDIEEHNMEKEMLGKIKSLQILVCHEAIEVLSSLDSLEDSSGMVEENPSRSLHSTDSEKPPEPLPTLKEPRSSSILKVKPLPPASVPPLTLPPLPARKLPKQAKVAENVPTMPSRKPQCAVIKAKVEKKGKKSEFKESEFKSVPAPQDILSLLESNSTHWHEKLTVLKQVQHLAEHQPDILIENVHEFSSAVIKEAMNLRSAVSREAIVTLGHLSEHLRGHMNSELLNIIKVLLQRSMDTKNFICDEVSLALSKIMKNCSTTKAMKALVEEGLCHQHVAVRECTARHLKELAEKLGPDRFARGPRSLIESFLKAASQLAADPALEVRSYARSTLMFLITNEDILRLTDKYVDPKNKWVIADIAVI